MRKKTDRNDSIKIKINADKKEKFKQLMKEKNISMSDFLNAAIDAAIFKNELKIDFEKLENKTIETDEKLLNLKEKLIDRSNSYKKNSIEKILDKLKKR